MLKWKNLQNENMNVFSFCGNESNRRLRMILKMRGDLHEEIATSAITFCYHSV